MKPGKFVLVKRGVQFCKAEVDEPLEGILTDRDGSAFADISR